MDKINLTILGKNHEFVKQHDASEFKFHCRDDCTKCCENSTVFLSPYDLQRVLQAKQVTFQHFLNHYGLLFYNQDLHNMLSLKLRSNPACVFLKEGLCSIYENRPFGCRMYPLGFHMQKKEEAVFFDSKECPGFGEGKDWNVAKWKKDSGITEYMPFFKIWDSICTYFDHHNFPKDNMEFVKIFYNLAYDIWSEDNKDLLGQNNVIFSDNREERLNQSLKILINYIKQYHQQKQDKIN